MRRRWGVAVLACALAIVTGVLPALADGNQVLGTPSVPIAGGDGFVVGGTGLADTGAGTIDVDVPDGTSVVQVLLYWEGEYKPNLAGSVSDATAVVDGNAVTGTLIGSSVFFTDPADGQQIVSHTYRADITGLGLISAGANSVAVSGLDFGYITNGAGVIVIYDIIDESTADIDIRDGNDGAYAFFQGDRAVTVPQTFTFDPAPIDRLVHIAMLVSSAADPFRDSLTRPNLVVISGDVSTEFVDPFADLDGAHWDSLLLGVTVPAGATTLTIEVVSPDNGYPLSGADRPASLFWNAAGLSVPTYAPPPPPGDACTRTQGYWQTHSEVGPAPYDATWDAFNGGNDPFFASSLSYIETLQASSAGGNAYFMLAQQYIAAELNGLAGADQPQEVLDALADAKALLQSYSSTELIPKKTADRATALQLATLLDGYNNGLLGVDHCE